MSTANAGATMQATAGTPRPWTFFWCRGRSPDLQVAVVPLVFPMRIRISDATIGSNSLLTVAGAVPDFRAPNAIHQLPS